MFFTNFGVATQCCGAGAGPLNRLQLQPKCPGSGSTTLGSNTNNGEEYKKLACLTLALSPPSQLLPTRSASQSDQAWARARPRTPTHVNCFSLNRCIFLHTAQPGVMCGLVSDQPYGSTSLSGSESRRQEAQKCTFPMRKVSKNILRQIYDLSTLNILLSTSVVDPE